MKILLQRNKEINDCTFGDLIIDGKVFCKTLEDKIRPIKIKGETAIPEGTYQILITYSPKFKKPMPLLLHVENYEGIRIHSGSTTASTNGCLIVGEYINKEENQILYSRDAFDRLFKFIEDTLKKEYLWIEIKNPSHIEPEIITPIIEEPQIIVTEIVTEKPIEIGKTEIKLTFIQKLINLIKQWLTKL